MINRQYIQLIILSILLGVLGFGRLNAQKNDFIPQKEFADVFAKLAESKRDGKGVRILHLGDSHIKQGYCTDPIRAELQKEFGILVKVEPMGVNGATFTTFSTSEQIQKIVDFEPDLMIVSLGTNDSYSNRFSAQQMKYNMRVFFSMLEERVPNLPIILTTPPASYFRHRKRIRRRRYRTSYSFNRQTKKASNTLKYLARNEGYGLIDLNQRYGSVRQTQSWLKKGLMRDDHVHYSVKAYNIFGRAIADALIDFAERSNRANEES